MSSAPACAPAMPAHYVIFAPREQSALLRQLSAIPKLAGVTPASRLEVRPAPPRVFSGIAELDTLTGGLPRGGLTEICGPTSSGCTSVLLAALAAATQRQEVCALVDTSDALDPQSAAAAGVDLERLLWVRCGEKTFSPQRHRGTEKTKSKFTHAGVVEQALRVLDLLLQSGGFGMVAVDFGDVPLMTVRRIPLASWFRFKHAVEYTPTVLLAIAQAPCAQTCAAMVIKLRGHEASGFGNRLSGLRSRFQDTGNNQPFKPGETLTDGVSILTHAQLFGGLEIEGELLRSRLERKPVQSAIATFTTKAVRAG